jgi:YndJ-like protein
VGVLLGKGDGTLQPVVSYNSGGLSPASLVIADVNRSCDTLSCRCKGGTSPLARGFLRASSAAVVIGMALAGTYALGDYLERDWLLIPGMTSTLGLLNGLGFVMFGLLGWPVESSHIGGVKSASRFASHQSNLGSLPDTSEVTRTIGN